MAYENGTAVDDTGRVEVNLFTNKMVWHNGTFSSYEITKSGDSNVNFGFDFFSAIGMFSVVAGIMALSIVLGVRILNSGFAGETIKIIVFGTALSGIWVVLSVPAFNLITAIPLVGFIMYGVLTIMFGMGAINQLSGGGGDDL